jgi:hypothetical protein
MVKIDLVIKLCILEDRQELTLPAVKHYFVSEEILSHHHKNSENVIRQFQDDADLFMMEWVFSYGNTGITHYIHMFASGHMRWYMEEYGNLHHLSQQGFESMNALITSFFSRRTQLGGFTSQKIPSRCFFQ